VVRGWAGGAVLLLANKNDDHHDAPWTSESDASNNRTHPPNPPHEFLLGRGGCRSRSGIAASSSAIQSGTGGSESASAEAEAAVGNGVAVRLVPAVPLAVVAPRERPSGLAAALSASSLSAADSSCGNIRRTGEIESSSSPSSSLLLLLDVFR
jgi:hypothetical protein